MFETHFLIGETSVLCHFSFLTFGLPHGQQDVDVDGEYHGGDDDGGEGARGDVGKVRREEGAGGEDDEAGDAAAESGAGAAGRVDGAAAEAGHHGHGAHEGAHLRWFFLNILHLFHTTFQSNKRITLHK